jgi:3-hydroxy-9,10-secoandrosta-1,3,5(10)-triene-9,17-dione monooxygenase
MLELVQSEKAPARTADETAFLTGIDALLPVIRAQAGEVERLNRVPESIVQTLTDAHVFRAVQPRQWGGLELDLGCFYEGMARIGSACGSTGWVASVVGIHPWQIALFPNEAQRDVWGDNPDTRASSSYAPTGSVRRVDGGFHLSGHWYFSSGVDHCDWVLLGGLAPHDNSTCENSKGEFRTFLVPKQDFTIDHESWQVTGLAGTGSKDVVVSGAFVPEYRTHSIVDVYNASNPGFAVNDRPYYRLPWRLVFAYTIAAPAIGAAAGALDAFVAQNSRRVSAYGGPPVVLNRVLQQRLAQAMTALDAARRRLRTTWTEFIALLEAGQAIPYIRRAQCLYEAAHAHDTCTGAVYDLMGVNGGRTMRTDGAVQRFFRDLLAMRNHPAADMEFSARLYAQAKLGMDPPAFDPTHRFVL